MTAFEARKRLKAYRLFITRAQERTLVGQINAGHIDGAMRGLDNILFKFENKKEKKNHGN